MTSTLLASSAIERYLEHLASDEFEEAAEQFTRDVVYYHPPNFEGVRRIDGRAELLEYFTDVRGPQDHDHEITKRVDSDGKGAVVGTITGGKEDGGIFVAYAEMDGEEISYYVAGLNENPD